MKQSYHSIFRPDANGWYVGWIEEIPGTITFGKSLEECRANLRDSLTLMLQTHRDEARLGICPGCIMEPMEVEVGDDVPLSRQVH